MNPSIDRFFCVSLVASLLFFGIGCSTSKTLIYNLNTEIWKQHGNGSKKELLIKKGERPRWIPGQKTHFAYIERKGGTPYVKLWVAEKDGKNPKAITGFEVGSEYSWSPDGKWIAVDHTKDGNHEIYKLKIDGSKPIRLTNNPYTDSFPRWSPKGDKIAFISTRNGREDIYVINADGTGEKRLSASNHIGDDDSPDWSYYGDKIVYCAWRGMDSKNHPVSYIEVVDVATGKIDRIVKSGMNVQPHFEEQYILYLSSILNTKFTLRRYDSKTGNSNSLGTWISYASPDPLTSNAAHVYISKRPTTSGPFSIFSVQHYSGDQYDLGLGRQPDVW